MTEWRLFPEGEPFFTTLPFFQAHPWVAPGDQVGHPERIKMTAELVRRVVLEFGPASISDLGCGDGSLLAELRSLPVPGWGYDAGWANVDHAVGFGLDVRHGDILAPAELDLGELVVASEVVEHLLDPHGWLRGLPADLLVVTSPSAETDRWHYEHHAWAWDLDGYAELVTGCGWQVWAQVECDGGAAIHMGHRADQRFQAVAAVRPGRVR